jgi:flagellar assembly factor FliW
MQIQTSRFGLLNLEETTFICFPWGIPGFENLKRYVLLQHRDGPFQWLQAVDDPDVAFVVCPPEVVGVLYRIGSDQGKPIRVEKAEDLAVFVLVSFDRAGKNIRAHLRSPLLVNAATREGYQWILDAEDLPKVTVPAPQKEPGKTSTT